MQPTRSRILIVDDDGTWAGLMAEILEDAGYDVTCADDGRMALVELERCEPSVMMTDIQMPVMDGRELVARVRARNDARSDKMPVIVCTGDSSLGADANLPGAFRVLHKPASINEVLAALDDAIAQRVARRGPRHDPTGH
jgi:two-component system chemotaxis response regulator CheY